MQDGYFKPKKVHVFVNGREQYMTFNIHPRCRQGWNALLDWFSRSLNPYFGAIRVLRTIDGKKIIHDFDHLENDTKYVACGFESFQKLRGGYEGKFSMKRLSGILFELCTLWRHFRYRRSSEKNLKEKPVEIIKKEDEEKYPCLVETLRKGRTMIYVFANGMRISPKKVVLMKSDFEEWDTILRLLAIILDIPEGVRGLCTIFGQPICSPYEIQHGGYYVAIPFTATYKQIKYLAVPKSRGYREQSPLVTKEVYVSAGKSCSSNEDFFRKKRQIRVKKSTIRSDGELEQSDGDNMNSLKIEGAAINKKKRYQMKYSKPKSSKKDVPQPLLDVPVGKNSMKSTESEHSSILKNVLDSMYDPQDLIKNAVVGKSLKKGSTSGSRHSKWDIVRDSILNLKLKDMVHRHTVNVPTQTSAKFHQAYCNGSNAIYVNDKKYLIIPEDVMEDLKIRKQDGISPLSKAVEPKELGKRLEIQEAASDFLGILLNATELLVNDILFGGGPPEKNADEFSDQDEQENDGLQQAENYAPPDEQEYYDDAHAPENYTFPDEQEYDDPQDAENFTFTDEQQYDEPQDAENYTFPDEQEDPDNYPPPNEQECKASQVPENFTFTNEHECNDTQVSENFPSPNEQENDDTRIPENYTSPDDQKLDKSENYNEREYIDSQITRISTDSRVSREPRKSILLTDNSKRISKERSDKTLLFAPDTSLEDKETRRSDAKKVDLKALNIEDSNLDFEGLFILPLNPPKSELKCLRRTLVDIRSSKEIETLNEFLYKIEDDVSVASFGRALDDNFIKIQYESEISKRLMEKSDLEDVEEELDENDTEELKIDKNIFPECLGDECYLKLASDNLLEESDEKVIRKGLQDEKNNTNLAEENYSEDSKDKILNQECVGAECYMKSVDDVLLAEFDEKLEQEKFHEKLADENLTVDYEKRNSDQTCVGKECSIQIPDDNLSGDIDQQNTNEELEEENIHEKLADENYRVDYKDEACAGAECMKLADDYLSGKFDKNTKIENFYQVDENFNQKYGSINFNPEYDKENISQRIADDYFHQEYENQNFNREFENVNIDPEFADEGKCEEFEDENNGAEFENESNDEFAGKRTFCINEDPQSTVEQSKNAQRSATGLNNNEKSSQEVVHDDHPKPTCSAQICGASKNRDASNMKIIVLIDDKLKPIRSDCLPFLECPASQLNIKKNYADKSESNGKNYSSVELLYQISDKNVNLKVELKNEEKQYQGGSCSNNNLREQKSPSCSREETSSRTLVAHIKAKLEIALDEELVNLND